MARAPQDVHEYQVSWICAVQTEYVIACELLDEEYPSPPLISSRDNSVYTVGRSGDHYVMIACLPKGKYGLTSAASVAKDVLHSFPSTRFGLMVDIGGGAPGPKHDIRLGDVVVSAGYSITNHITCEEKATKRCPKAAEVQRLKGGGIQCQADTKEL
jgi:hypothetical protein